MCSNDTPSYRKHWWNFVAGVHQCLDILPHNFSHSSEISASFSLVCLFCFSFLIPSPVYLAAFWLGFALVFSFRPVDLPSHLSMSRKRGAHQFSVVFPFSGRSGWPCGRLWPEGKPLMLASRTQKSTTTSSAGTGWSSRRSAWKMCEYFLSLLICASLRGLAYGTETGAAGWDSDLNPSTYQHTEAFTRKSLG